MKFAIPVALALVVVVPQSAKAAEFPYTYSNCHLEFTVDKAPERAVSLNQGTTEMLLGLGLEDRMAGTAYLDDAIWPEFEEAYNKVPVLEESAYPDIDALSGAQPDFIYASYRSAFQAKTEEEQKRIEYYDWIPVQECELTIEGSNGNETFCRKELDSEMGIASYLQVPYCEMPEYRLPETQLEDLYNEINTIASIFGVEENAESLISTIEGHFQDAQALVQEEAEPMSVLFLDSWGDETPLVGACCGSINAIIEYAGAINVFKDVGLEDRKSWARVNWTDIVEADPDVIIVVDASWDPADKKLYNLCNNEVTRGLSAVQNRRFITVPFSATTFGVRIGSLALNLAEAVKALVMGEPLSSTSFTEAAFADIDAVEAIGTSGAIVYTRLPLFNNVDLETFCPGGQSNIFIGDMDEVTATDAEEEDHGSHDEKEEGHDSHDEKEEGHDSHDEEGHDSHDHDHDHDEDHDEEMKESSASKNAAFVGSLAMATILAVLSW